MADITVDSLLEELNRSEGNEKVAFARGDVDDAATSELLEKVASEMDAGEIRKAAAAAKLSGNIMADVILEKIASQLAPATANAVHEKIASILPQVVASVVPYVVNDVLQKLAVGTSTAITGYSQKAVPNDESAGAVQIANDKVGKGKGDRTAKYWGAEMTSGASVEGGGAGALEGGAGEKPEAWEPVHKLSAAKAKINQYLKKHELEKNAYLKAIVEDPNKSLEDYKSAEVEAANFMKAAHYEVQKFAAEMGMGGDPGMAAAGGPPMGGPPQGGGGIEADLARYQELQSKKEAGALTPEEAQELQMLEQKLMAAAGGAQQGAGAPAGGPPGEAGPPGGGAPPGPGSMGDGGMPRMASVRKTASKADIKKLLASYGLKA